MIRFIPVTENDLLTDPEEVGEMLAKAVRRKIPMRLASFGAIGGGSYLAVLEEIAEPGPAMEFVFSPFSDATFDGVAAEIETRYESGYETRAVFEVDHLLWGLFTRESRFQKGKAE